MQQIDQVLQQPELSQLFESVRQSESYRAVATRAALNALRIQELFTTLRSIYTEDTVAAKRSPEYGAKRLLQINELIESEFQQGDEPKEVPC
jgi:hypothetical protein